MKVKVVVEFNYDEKMTKDIDQFAKEQNVPIEDIARIGMQNLLDNCYDCMDGESYSVSGELVED